MSLTRVPVADPCREGPVCSPGLAPPLSQSTARDSETQGRTGVPLDSQEVIQIGQTLWVLVRGLGAPPAQHDGSGHRVRANLSRSDPACCLGFPLGGPQIIFTGISSLSFHNTPGRQVRSPPCLQVETLAP